MVMFGRETVIKFVGGEMHVREVGTDATAMKGKLLGVKRRMLNLSVPFGAFKPIWLQQEREVFAAQGLPVRWPALTPVYAAWKAQHYPGKTILRRSDALYDSLTSDGDSNMIWRATPRTIQFGSRIRYFLLHQTGAGRLPARPALVLLPSTFRRLTQMCMDWVARGNA